MYVAFYECVCVGVCVSLQYMCVFVCERGRELGQCPT